MANDKTYSVAEATQILMKSVKEKVEAFEKEIANQHARELKKAIIPSHKHNQGTVASAGIEDVPPGKANPKGIEKTEPSKVVVHDSSKPKVPSDQRDYTAQVSKDKTVFKPKDVKKAELCKKCGKEHGPELEKCGDMEPGKVVKSDLVDAKGNKKDNHTVKGAVLPDDKKSKVIDTKEGSGGAIKKGAEEMSKAGAAPKPPQAKPPSGAMGAAVPTSKNELEKGVMADVVARESAHAGAPKPAAPNVQLPSQAQHAARAAGYQAAMSGAYSPSPAPAAPAPVMPKPAVKPPAGLKSPTAAGVKSAGPVMNAARPQAPGIFGKLFGGK